MILCGNIRETAALTKSLEAEEARGWPNLLVAAEKGDAEAVRSELAAGADINEMDEGGWSALHLAALNARTAAVEALIENPAIDVNSRNKWKSTPLSLASARGHYAPVSALVKHPKIEINARADYYGRTALIEAAKNGHLDVVKLLLENGADVNLTDKTGRNNALIEAIKGRHYEIAEYLLESGKVNFLNKEMRLNALIWAGSIRNHHLIEKLEAAIHRFFEGK
ncbi:ankyrin repeat domain-containing protein [Mesorhizobium metallidurans]|uniref:ankyrin repeat domain-containing protein n=1 Tax=Mesorhizobium metallidurans TaxID=489722 RepID=UPI000A01BD2F|nr:ankyrin repeat domain-containing protein [Mesorhizobium metallidurans]